MFEECEVVLDMLLEFEASIEDKRSYRWVKNDTIIHRLLSLVRSTLSSLSSLGRDGFCSPIT